MKKLFTLLTMAAFLTFSSCEFLEETSRCDEGALYGASYTATSSNAKFTIKVLSSDVSSVKIYATYNIKRCAKDEKKYYTTGTKTYFLDGPETIDGDLVGYRCSTEIRNTEDELNVYLYTIFTSKSGDIKTITTTYSKHYNYRTFEPDFTVTFTGF